MCTLLHPHDTYVWGDMPRGLGTIVMTFKPSGETCQIRGECLNHLHHIPHSGITFLTFEHLHSLMLEAYENSIWCVLEFHSDGRNVKFSDLFVTLGVILL